MKSRHPARKTLARRIRLLRTLHGWSQEVLAELVGLHRTYVGALERAEQNPCLDNIEKIANALEVPVRSLLDERFAHLFGENINRVEEARTVYDGSTYAKIIPLVDIETRTDYGRAA